MDPGNLYGLAGFFLVFLILLRLLNNLLRAAYYMLGRISILALAEKAREKNDRLSQYIEEPVRLNFATMVLDKVVLFFLLMVALQIVPKPGLVHFGSLILYFLVFDLLVPIVFSAYFSDRLVTNLFPMLRIPFLLCSPIVYILVALSRRGEASNGEEEEEDDPEDIRAFLKAGQEEGIIEDKETMLLHNLLHFSDTVVREVMTPRTDMQGIEINMSREEILNVFKTTRFSRLPVYHEDIDHIDGVLRLKDLVMSNKPVKDLLQDVLYIPENKSISDLLQEMLKQRLQMVIVIDEFGGTAGLTTLEDLIEEIVGEIHDEHETPEADEIITLPDGSFLVDGKVLLEDFCEMFQLDVEEEDVDTVGGFIFNQEGRIPKVGTTCTIGQMSVEIAKADDRRIYKLKVQPRPEEVLAE